MRKVGGGRSSKTGASGKRAILVPVPNGLGSHKLNVLIAIPVPRWLAVSKVTVRIGRNRLGLITLVRLTETVKDEDRFGNCGNA